MKWGGDEMKSRSCVVVGFVWMGKEATLPDGSDEKKNTPSSGPPTIGGARQ